MPRKGWRIGGVILLVVVVVGAYASYYRENEVKSRAHQESLRDDGPASRVSCVRSPVSSATRFSEAISYHCTSANGARIADVQVQHPYARTPIKSKLLSVMVAEESR
jgi:hypothetical protein